MTTEGEDAAKLILRRVGLSHEVMFLRSLLRAAWYIVVVLSKRQHLTRHDHTLCIVSRGIRGGDAPALCCSVVSVARVTMRLCKGAIGLSL